jgi:hypothetical protein
MAQAPSSTYLDVTR